MRQTHIVNNFYDYVFDLRNNSEIKQVQKAIKLIREDSSNPSLKRHSLDRVKERNLVSYYVNRDIRIISFEPPNQDRYLVYVDHHDSAYNWARTKKIDLDPSLDVIKVVGISASDLLEDVKDETSEDTVEEKNYDNLLPERKKGKSYLFDPLDNNALSAAGIAPNFLELSRRIHDEQDVLFLIDKIPPSIGNGIFSLCDELSHESTIDEPVVVQEPVEQIQKLTKIETDDEFDQWVNALDEALNLDFDRWRSFLHPAQRAAVCANSKGPIRVTGGAGTGKTVVGIHRCVHLVESKKFKSAYFITYNRTLMKNLEKIVRNVFGTELGKTYKVCTYYDYIKDRLAKDRDIHINLQFNDIAGFLKPGMNEVEPEHWSDKDTYFIFSEIQEVIAAQRIQTIDSYIRAKRKGRGRTISVAQKEELWKIYEYSWNYAKERKAIPGELIAHFALDLKLAPQEDCCLVVDEVQDLKAVDLAFLGEQSPAANQLTLLEDTKQRIYGSGYSLKALGINVVGKRSQKLFVNYRTTEEIGKAAALSLHGLDIHKIDLPTSLRSGDDAVVKRFSSSSEEAEWVKENIYDLKKKGVSRIAVLGRSRNSVENVQSQLTQDGIEYEFIESTNPVPDDDVVSVCTMHSSKGLEFEAVFVVGLDYGMDGLPAKREIRDNKKLLEDHQRRERHLLYVATSRARDQLFLSGCGEVIDLF